MSNVQATLLCNGFTVLTLPVDGEAMHVMRLVRYEGK